MNKQRFVVLEHSPGVQLDRTHAIHFDWMFETEGRLQCWATEPIERIDLSSGSCIEVPAQPLADHRIEYLDYEGEIGGNRGIVRRVAHGYYDCVSKSDHDFIADLRFELPRLSKKNPTSIDHSVVGATCYSGTIPISQSEARLVIDTQLRLMAVP